jgi:CRP-like cAMP-binding protein
MLQDPYHETSSRQQELLSILRHTRIFSRSTEDQLQALARRTRVVPLGSGETLFRHGEKARAIYVLLDGRLKLYRTSVGGDEVIIDLLEPGTTFGESRVILNDPRYHLSCAALADSEVAVVELSAFLALLQESHESCLLLIQHLAERDERNVDEIDRLVLQSGTARVAGFLLGQLPPGRDEYVLQVPKSVMACRLAIRAETLSRILKQLSTRGIVSFQGRNVVRVHSRERLQRLAMEHSRYSPGCRDGRRVGKGR